MNLLLVTSSPFHSTYGGGQVYVKNLVDELVRRGLSPIIATPGSCTVRKESYKGCTNYTFDALLVQKDFKTLNPLLAEIKPDLVHAHGFKAPFASACKDLNIPCIITAHHGGILCPAGTLLNYHDEICHIKANSKDCLPCVLKNISGGMITWPLLKMLPLSIGLHLGRLMQRLPFIYYFTPVLQSSLSVQKKGEEWEKIYTHASLLIAPSKAIAESMELNGAPVNKIKIIPHGIPLPLTVASSEDKKAEKNESLPLRIFYVGRVCHVKGVHVMLAAFSQLSTNAELHIIGGTSNKTEEVYIQQLKKAYSHNPRIIWHGKAEPPEVKRLIVQFNVMVHPAIFLEAFGLTIAEALALGKPVIATRCGGAEMQIKEGVNGWLVEPNNVDALIEVIQKLIDHPELLNRVKKKILKSVQSIQDHVFKLIQLYEEIID